jgi:hypothetical protein
MNYQENKTKTFFPADAKVLAAAPTRKQDDVTIDWSRKSDIQDKLFDDYDECHSEQLPT